MPEYLVLVERRAASDQDAQRLRSMVEQLGDLVPVTLFHFSNEPSFVEPQKRGEPLPAHRAFTGRPIPITAC